MRKLASIDVIKNLEPIEGADRIEKATVQGWNVVVKKGEFSVGDKCVFFQIDSLLPLSDNRFSFLRKNESDEKARLKTVKLKGVISQGLALPISLFPEISDLPVGTDVTETLKIEKYEPPIPIHLQGNVLKFEWPISKTDETRIQEDPEFFINAIVGKPYYITQKLDGTSATYILYNDNFYVCSRNFALKEDESNLYWIVAKKISIENILREYKKDTGKEISLQGEIVGPGIQKNPLNLKDHEFKVFNIVETETNKRFHFNDMVDLVKKINGLSLVPIIEIGDSFPNIGLSGLLEKAKGKYSRFFPDSVKDQEGIVVRSQDQSISFKVINNDYLLKEDV